MLHNMKKTMSMCSAHVSWVVVTLSVIAVDRVTKSLVLDYLPYQEPVVVMPFFNLFFTRNAGAAFSFLQHASGWQNWLFSFIAFVVSGLIVVDLLRIKDREVWRKIALALVLGGALGNLCDRLMYQYVIDFLDFHFMNCHWPAFNVADTAICIGSGWLVLRLNKLIAEEKSTP